MDETKKEKILVQAKQHVVKVSEKILETKSRVDNSIIQLRKELVKARGDERDTKEILLYHHLDTERNMAQQQAAPYFVRCDVVFNDENEEKTLYFGRFPYTTESIYSWIAPVSQIRFESPGSFSYDTPSGEKRTGRLIRKDQFMIVNGKILFMSTESEKIPRDLIYQEYFTQKKSKFVLKEIVEQMEKAQDRIIRSHYFGSFLTSGPAGSGKTTLALHRAAYLIQSPDTSDLFHAKNVMIFVQDKTTKNYFGELLPQLGIHKVMITTFSEWAQKILGLQDFSYSQNYGKNETEKDLYEYAKKQALKNIPKISIGKDIYKKLAEVYNNFFSDQENNLFEIQKENQILDRFDLTILLKLSLLEKGYLIERVEKFEKLLNGRYVKRIVQQQLNYSLIVLDEAENYLAEQIDVIKSTADKKTNSLIYVGDLVQRTIPYTISDWKEVQEEFSLERKVVLQKVYRNTRQILQYIQSLGYDVSIPEKIKDGKMVEECILDSKEEELQKILSVLEEKKNTVVGVLAKSDKYLDDFRKHFSHYPYVHALTINEAQGVEFDTVFLVGIDKKAFDVSALPEHLRAERSRVNHDLLYVALTRAMNELYVLGRESLKNRQERIL